ncbi:AAA family ATPase [Bradyrhizobium sp. UFLA05-109]
MEEPELYQHRPQAWHLASVLTRLGTTNSQIVATTHSPHFVSGDGFEKVRTIRNNLIEKRSKVALMSYADLSKAIAGATVNRQRSPPGHLQKSISHFNPRLTRYSFTHAWCWSRDYRTTDTCPQLFIYWGNGMRLDGPGVFCSGQRKE